MRNEEGRIVSFCSEVGIADHSIFSADLISYILFMYLITYFSYFLFMFITVPHTRDACL